MLYRLQRGAQGRRSCIGVMRRSCARSCIFAARRGVCSWRRCALLSNWLGARRRLARAGASSCSVCSLLDLCMNLLDLCLLLHSACQPVSVLLACLRRQRRLRALLEPVCAHTQRDTLQSRTCDAVSAKQFTSPARGQRFQRIPRRAGSAQPRAPRCNREPRSRPQRTPLLEFYVVRAVSEVRGGEPYAAAKHAAALSNTTSLL